MHNNIVVLIVNFVITQFVFSQDEFQERLRLTVICLYTMFYMNRNRIHLFVRISACSLVKYSSFTGFCWWFRLVIL